ncbi:MAG TPA: hypothetical protein VKT77_08635, partial [Chthonomonadaceae bacterium]|nr:hypothetical protein [Chthonomonadaceae bacterium]
MRQRVDRTALPILAAAGLAAVFAAAGLRPAAADENAAGADSDLPVLLLVQERPAANSPQAADIGIRLRTTLREALTHSGRFQVHTFLPGDSVIKRALNEHLIAADDLAEPHRVESLERIAKAIGARFILNYNTTVNRTEAHTELKYLDNPGRADWMVLADQQISIPLVIG